LKIVVGIEDSGINLSALITNRTPYAARYGCILSAQKLSQQSVCVEVSGCDMSVEAEMAVLCSVLADIILENLQIRFLLKCLKKSCKALSEKEMCDVLVGVLKKMWFGVSARGRDIGACKADIKKRLISAIEKNDAESIILEGFMRFRMKDYLRLWENELKSHVRRYLRKKEYAEFVEILRLFISIRIPREKTIHLCVDGRGDYFLLNEKMYMLHPGKQRPSDKDDALLSKLVNLAPYHIIVHNKERFEDERMLETIKDVFGKRVEFSDKMI